MNNKQELNKAIIYFEAKIKKQGRIINARDEEQLTKLKQISKQLNK